jgi:hypothetical protein
MGCLDDLVAHEAVIGPSLVIGKDEHNVRRFGGSNQRKENGKQKKYTLHAPKVQQLLC